MTLRLCATKLTPDAVLPTRAHPGDAGLDLTANHVVWQAHRTELVAHTGLAIAVPPGHVGLLFARSSIARTGLALTNGVGVIDSGYRGELILKFRAIKHGVGYKAGDRVGQLVIVPIPLVEIDEVATLDSTERGAGGFGSTGK